LSVSSQQSTVENGDPIVQNHFQTTNYVQSGPSLVDENQETLTFIAWTAPTNSFEYQLNEQHETHTTAFLRSSEAHENLDHPILALPLLSLPTEEHLFSVQEQCEEGIGSENDEVEARFLCYMWLTHGHSPLTKSGFY
jgi:hypothetical protein